MVLQDWISMVGNVNFPLVSDTNIGEDNIGIPQSLGAALFNGYPVPTTVILDRNGMVRYTEATDPEMADGSVEEILRMVRALKMVDEGKGMTVTPPDWTSDEPAIRNTIEGVNDYYEGKYAEEEKGDQDG